MPIIKVNTVVVYETPIGFHNYASDFAAWANRARTEKYQFFSPVPYYLYCRSIELVIKAFLLAKGMTKKQLKARKFGHNLIALLNESRKMGLEDIVVIKSKWEVELSKANDYYFKKDFEYFNVALGYHGLPSLVVLNELSEKLLNSLKRVCQDAADSPPKITT